MKAAPMRYAMLENQRTGSTPGITVLLRRLRDGDKTALDSLIPIVYRQLHAMASKCMQGERGSHTLRTTALVHEAYMRLAGSNIGYEDRIHFFSVAARMMRRILVDHARSIHRGKRGGDHAKKIPLDYAAASVTGEPLTVIAVDAALEKLALIDNRKSEILEMLYFGGMTGAEAAQAIGLSEAAFYRELKLAKAWMQRELGPRPRGVN
jgi:RNA polymerase sigma factor (TIGR02999 family)